MPLLQAIGDLRHDRLVGFSAGCSLSTWGDAASCVDYDEDNDGLWTSVCAALILKPKSCFILIICRRYTAGLVYKYTSPFPLCIFVTLWQVRRHAGRG